MFEYDLFSFRVYGFNKIKYINEDRLVFVYKNKELVISGKGLKVSDLLDKSIVIKGIIDSVSIKYLGGNDD